MTAVESELREGESLLSDADELLYRQITKHLMDGEKISTAAFGPTTADNGMPSYSRSTLVQPQESRDWHTRIASSPSLGVWAVSVEDVIEVGRYAVDDSAIPLKPGEKRAPGHCFVDFRGLSRPERKTIRALLWLRADQRGEIPTTATLADGALFA